MPLDIGKVILHSDLIVYATARSEQNHTFKIEVIDIWLDKGYGIKKEDYLKIPKEIVFECGFSTNAVTEVGTGVFFLKKEDNTWRLVTYNFIPRFVNGNASTLVFECYYTANFKKWKNNIQAFLKEFHLDQYDYILASKSEEEILRLPTLLPLVHEYYRNFYPNLRFQIKSKLDCPYITESQLEADLKASLIPKSDTFIYKVPEKMALPPEPFDSLLSKITALLEEKHPEIIEMDIYGRMYYSLLIEKDSSVSKVKTLRSLHPDLDKDVQEYLMSSSPWIPAKQGRRSVRSQISIPIKFNYPK